MKSNYKFVRTETQYIIRRFNNDFISKCIIDDRFRKMENTEENFKKKERMILDSFMMCDYYFSTATHNYHITNTDDGLHLKKINLETNAIDEATISWKTLTLQIDKLISSDIFLTEKQKNARVFVPSLYETIVKNKKCAGIDINDERKNEDIKKYIHDFITYSKNHEKTMKILKNFKCRSSEDIKNRLLLDRNFLNEMRLAVHECYNQGTLGNASEKEIQFSMNTLIILYNIDEIKEKLSLDRSIGDFLRMNDINYVISDIEDNHILLKDSNGNSKEIVFGQLISHCIKDPKSERAIECIPDINFQNAEDSVNYRDVNMEMFGE